VSHPRDAGQRCPHFPAGSRLALTTTPAPYLPLRALCALLAVRVPLQITLQFQTNGFHLNASDEIYLRMPRFTSGDGSGESGPTFEIHQHSWATMFQIFWNEGTHTSSQTRPFPLTNMTIRVREGRQLVPSRAYEIIISPSNGIRAQCSFVENDEDFLMGTNASKALEPRVRGGRWRWR